MEAAVAVAERPQREVAESLLLLLNAEMVQSLSDRLGPEAAMAQLNIIGFSAGVRLATRLVATRFPIMSERTAMKYVCKELWTFLFRKPANRLQTDRCGSYIVHDTCFRWLESLSPPMAVSPAAVGSGSPSKGAASPVAAEKAAAAAAAELQQQLQQLQELVQLHLALPCGMLRGALLALGIECSVTATASVQELPACGFTITLQTPSQEEEAERARAEAPVAGQARAVPPPPAVGQLQRPQSVQPWQPQPPSAQPPPPPPPEFTPAARQLQSSAQPQLELEVQLASQRASEAPGLQEPLQLEQPLPLQQQEPEQQPRVELGLQAAAVQPEPTGHAAAEAQAEVQPGTSSDTAAGEKTGMEGGFGAAASAATAEAAELVAPGSTASSALEAQPLAAEESGAMPSGPTTEAADAPSAAASGPEA